MLRPRLFLIDSYGFIFRAYHARARSAAPPMRTSKGLSTEAVYIFHNMLRKLRASYNPEYMAAIFESLGPTFREQSFAEYKANRAEAPADLSEQIPYVVKVLEAMHIPILQFAGFEADDVIGTIAKQASEDGRVDVVIVSSDKDMLQLVTANVSMYNPAKDDTWYDATKVQEFMGVPPGGVADLLALMGDSIDNIPGAPGIGEKGARDLILEYGSVENLLEHAAEVKRKSYRESLLNNRDQVVLSKKLATIDCNVPIEWSMEALQCQEADVTALRHLYRELEFFSLLKELAPTDSLEGKDYKRLTDVKEITEFIASIPADAPVAVAVSDPEMGLAWEVGQARAIPLEHWGLVKPLIEDELRSKITHDAKTACLSLTRHGMDPKGFNEDVLLHAFLLSADPAGSACEVLAEKFLDRKLSEQVELRADCALELYQKLHGEVGSRGLRKLYEEIDRPLTSVLIKMEHTGIRVEPVQLQRMSERMDAELHRLSQEVYQIAGCEFNINSPQQLGKILYEDLKLPAPVKYGKGKTLSTAADILEALAVDHPIAKLVLDYRQVAKLKGTYVDALPALIREDGRVHTTFNQAGAATGRLSSSNPNLQNIPIRTELGREIRAAFVPEPGWDLIVADYSQIELRLLAHMSQDKVLLHAFRTGEDIHTRTAAEVFGVMPAMVSPDMRRSAKAVNFGIVYGQTPFGLATQLGISWKEAEAYIRRYFELYEGVRDFIDRTILEVRETGVAKTLFGRERPIPDMKSRNPSLRSFAERTAVNTPLQGTAADLIKLAMIRIDRQIAAQGLRSRMLLQVHDELLLESPPEETNQVKEVVRAEMEGVWALDVPLTVDVGVGSNWRDAKE